MNIDSAREIEREPHGSSDDTDLLDFSANTNPAVPDGVAEVYHEAFEESRTYPEEPPENYRQTAAEYVGSRPEQVIPTPGGLAAIRLTIALTVDPGDSVLVPTPSFGEYAREVRLQGGKPIFEPQDQVLDADPGKYTLAIVCNPNNPTGDAYDRTALTDFARRCRQGGTVLLVDEAFLGFTTFSSLAGTEGTVVARSLTKLFGLPGIRAGFAVASEELRDALVAARRTWNVSRPALATGTFCMRQDEFVAETRQRVEHERERMRETLAGHYGIRPSDSPFLLLDVGDRSVDCLIETARERGIVIRDARTFRGLDKHVRVAVRRPAENDRLLEVLRDV